MSNKKTKRWVWPVVSIVLVLAICVAVGYAYTRDFFGTQSSVPEQSFAVYYLDSSKTKPVAEQRKLKVAEEMDILQGLVEQLLEGPQSKDNARAIPKGTKLLGMEKDGTVLTVNFSDKYYGPTAADDMLAAVTVVSTLCDIEGVQKVRILVEGSELIGTGKKPLGALGKEDLVLDSTAAEQEEAVVTLYFPLAGTDMLGAEKRKVILKDKVVIEKSIVSELMKGSDDKQRPRPIPAEAKLLSVETKDKICFVNFSKEFIEKHTAGSSSDLITVYSIVNSLTELESIQKVQFLIEGQKVEAFGNLVFNEPFERDESYIQP